MKTKEELTKAAEKAAELRNQIFDFANSFAGKETGSIAVYLHGAANILNDTFWTLNGLAQIQPPHES